MKRTDALTSRTWFASVVATVLFSAICSTQANVVERTVDITPTPKVPKVVAFNETDGNGLNWTAPDENKTLKVTLTNGDKEFKCDANSVRSESILWTCPTWNTWSTTHVFTSELVDPNDHFKPLFTGPMKTDAAAGAGALPRWSSGVIQADIQADADNDSTTAQRPPATDATERNQEEVAEQGGTGNPTGLIVPVNCNYHEGGTGNLSNIDFLHTGIVTSDPDLVRCRVILKLPDVVAEDSDSLVKLTYDDSMFLVYKVLPGGSIFPLPSGTQLSVSSFDVDSTLLLEGLAASSSCGGDSVLVTLTPKTGDVSLDEMIVTVVHIDLQISSGAGFVGANPISRTMANNTNHDTDALEDEEDLGTFAVANSNNTNGNLSGGADVPDLNENNVVANGSRGYDEVDLMLLHLCRPLPTDLPGNVRIRIVAGNVKIWPDATKGTQASDEITGAGLTKAVSDGTFWSDGSDWYVEAREATSLQGIKLKYEYQPNANGQWMTAPSDTVTATGIWVTHEAPEGTNAFEQLAGRNEVRIWFCVTPHDIAAVPLYYGDGRPGNGACRPRFDVTRQFQGTVFAWNKDAPGVGLYDRAPYNTWGLLGQVPYGHFPEFLPAWHLRNHNEYANDDDSRKDEPDNPQGFLFGYKVARVGLGDGEFMTALRANYKEFVRVRFDGYDPGSTPEVNDGSRCSAYVPWHARDTDGAVTAPRGISTGHIAFVAEALHTDANASTTPGTRHHAVCRGLDLSSGAGVPGSPQMVTVDVKAAGVIFPIMLHSGVTSALMGRMNMNPSGPPENDQTQFLDQLAYTAVGYFASARNGDIAGPDDTAGRNWADIYHKNTLSGDYSPAVSVSGTAAVQPAPEVPGQLALGAISTVTISNAFVDADMNGGGNQTVPVRIVAAGSVWDDLLDELSVSAQRQLSDEKTKTGVGAIKWAAFKFSTTGRLAAKADGKVIGPSGSTGQYADIAYEVGSSGSNSPVHLTSGSAYSMSDPVIGTNPIPVGGNSTVSINNIYIEATGTTGNEVFAVRVIDADDLSPDDLLDNITGVTIVRPAGCFPGALIGPTSTTGTLTNPAPGKEVKGPSGGSGEETAQIGYEIGPSSNNSPTVDVTAQ